MIMEALYKKQKISLNTVIKIFTVLLLLSLTACYTPVAPVSTAFIPEQSPVGIEKSVEISEEPQPPVPLDTSTGISTEESPLSAILSAAGRQPVLSPLSPVVETDSAPVVVPENPILVAEIDEIEELDVIEKRPVYLNALRTMQKTYPLTASFIDRTAIVGVISLPKKIEIAGAEQGNSFSVSVSSESTSAVTGIIGNQNTAKSSTANSYIEPVSIINVTPPESVKQISPAYSAVLNTSPSLVRFTFPPGLGYWLILGFIVIVISGIAAATLIPTRKKRETQ